MAENEATETESANEEEKELIQRAMDCLTNYEDVHNDNIERAKAAIEFRAGMQWPEMIRRDREDPNQDGGPRPCPVLDKTNQYVRQVINEERQNRAAIRIRPVDDDADPETAEIFNGIIRHIEDKSEAIEAYTTAGEHAIDGGFGYWRILADYSDPLSFDQDIRIKRIPNRFSVALGPHTEVDGSDAEEAMIWEDMDKKSFKAKYPNAKEVGIEAGESWTSKDTIRIAEYFYIEHKPTKIHLMDDDSVLTDEKFKELIGRIEEHNQMLMSMPPPEPVTVPDPATGQPVMIQPPMPEPVQLPEPKDSRETVIRQVKWCKLTAAEILEERDLVGTYIPIVKVTGNEIVMPDGKSRLSGMIEDMMDSQRLHNYAHAGFIEDVALAPRAPWIAEESSIENYEQDYADANRKPISVLKYKAISGEDGHPIPPPQRIPKAGLDSAWQQMLANTEHGVAAAVGMMAPGMMEAAQGVQFPTVSGVALGKQEARGMTVNYHFPDNLARSIQHTGRILLEWIPKYYDTPRVVRIIGEDGEEDKVKINPEQQAAIMPETDEYEKEIGKIYNLNVGKYDVSVFTGPSYSAKRQEAVEMQSRLIDARPELMNLMGDILFKNMDAPGSEEISERLKTLLPPEIQKMEAAEDEDPRFTALMGQVEQAAQQLEERAALLQQAEQKINEEANKTANDKTAVEAMKKELASDRKVFMMEMEKELANMQVEALKLKDAIEGMANKTDDDEIKLLLKLIEEDRKDVRFKREMRLKELKEGIGEHPHEDAIVDAVNRMVGEVESLKDLKMQKPDLNIEYDDDGNIISFNGRKIIRNTKGGMIGLEEPPETLQ